MGEMRVMTVGVEAGAARPVLLLQEAGGSHRLLPVWIGIAEANAITVEQHGVFGVDRDAQVQGERDGVADPGGYSSVLVEDQLGVEDVVADLGDPHLFQVATERVQDVSDELVGHRAR